MTLPTPQRIQIPLDELRQRSILIATPMYGGQCAGTYCKSIAQLTSWLSMHGVPYSLRFLFNESLITRARNYLAENFINEVYDRPVIVDGVIQTDENGNPRMEKAPFSHMIFIDSDITFTPDDVIQMLWMMSDDSPYDVLCGLYPKKNISWEKIKAAVDKGMADENPNWLANVVGDFVVNMPPGSTGFQINQPTEIMEAGTGFMMIRRKTFEQYNLAYPDDTYTPDHVRSNDFDGSKKIMMYFQAAIDPVSNRYLSEDYYFCQKVRQAGMKVWMLPWINLAHYGSMDFTGRIDAMAAAGVSITADEGLLKKYKNNENK